MQNRLVLQANRTGREEGRASLHSVRDHTPPGRLFASGSNRVPRVDRRSALTPSLGGK